MLDIEDPYESLPGGRSNSVYMLAGAAAGTLEHCIMYPADVIRTRMQSLVKPQMLANLKLYRGMSAVVVGAGPAHALYFSAYENLKQELLNSKSVTRILAHGISGCGATLLHDAVMNPFDVIKQRMQVCNSPFAGPTDCARHILKHEGINAFYRSYLTQLTMNLPFQSLHFITYEIAQDYLNRNRDYNPIAHIVSGGIAGATAAACTTPLDVCKTLLNTQEKQALEAANCDRVTGLFNAASIVYRCRGFQGFFLGITARVLVSTPSTAASWFVYEFFKNYMSSTSNSNSINNANKDSLPS